MTKDSKKAGWAEETEGVEEEVIKPLYFDSYGWCPELKKSYKFGKMTPKTLEEYKALKKYAKSSD